MRLDNQKTMQTMQIIIIKKGRMLVIIEVIEQD